MMTTKVELSEYFENKLKRLVRKYRSVFDEVKILIQSLQHDEQPGDKIAGIGYDVYKVRLKNRSGGKGKWGGFRVIYYVRRTNFIGLITIYSKSEETDITPQRLRTLIEEYLSTFNDERVDPPPP